MGTAVVRCNDLEVFDLPATIPVLVLDADIGKLDVRVFVRQAVRQGPLANLVGRAIGPAVTVPFLAIALLKEALIFALQLVIENDAPDMATTFSDCLCRSFVRSVKVRVVGDLGPPGEARIEALAIVERAVLGAVQQVAATFREGHERGP